MIRRLIYWGLRGFFAVYVFACLFALAIIPISAKGWFGIEKDPLAAVLAIMLGTPWSVLFARLTDGLGTMEALGLVILAMAINATILWIAGSLFRPVSARAAPGHSGGSSNGNGAPPGKGT